MGVHYPTDVIGGFALGTAVALLLAPLALALLTRLMGRLADSPAGRLVREPSVSPADRAEASGAGRTELPEHPAVAGEKDLAA